MITNSVPYIGGPIMGGTVGSLIFVGTNGVLQQSNTNLFWNNTNFRLGIGTASPTNDLSFGGQATRTVWMERNTTANTAGLGLTIQAGGATALATNKGGGALNLTAGQSTGSSATSAINFRTYSSGTAGTTDNTVSTKLSISSQGKLNHTPVISGLGMNLFDQTIGSGTLASGGSFIGFNHDSTLTSIVDSAYTGINVSINAIVGAADTGSSMNALSFVVYEDGANAGVGAGASAVSGFIRHSSGLAGLTFTGLSAELQDGGAGTAGAATFIALKASATQPFNASHTSWTGLYVAAPSNSAGVITTVNGIYIENIANGTNKWAIYSLGGASSHLGAFKFGANTVPTHSVDIVAGTTTRAPILMAPGTVLTTPVAGVIENDANFLYYSY